MYLAGESKYVRSFGEDIKFDGLKTTEITSSSTFVGGAEGFVNGVNTTSFNAELDSTQIQSLKHMGKIIYEYKLYTDPNLISPPRTTVKIRGSDNIRHISFGKLKYHIDF